LLSGEGAGGGGASQIAKRMKKMMMFMGKLFFVFSKAAPEGATRVRKPVLLSAWALGQPARAGHPFRPSTGRKKPPRLCGGGLLLEDFAFGQTGTH